MLLQWSLTDAVASGRLGDDTVVRQLVDGSDKTFMYAHWEIMNRLAFLSAASMPESSRSTLS